MGNKFLSNNRGSSNLLNKLVDSFTNIGTIYNILDI